ncbi:glycosyltransferase family 2 protein [Microcystis aeruginosa LEGE 00239]|nr:glycosyltransferase family 2 protein [Microcystis aeruginosa LEGE 00239]
MPVRISVVVPLYNEEENIDALFRRLLAVLEALNTSYEVICVNDGSRDNTLKNLVEYHQLYPQIKVVNLSRNFGKDIAMSAGIDYSQGMAVIPIDADLQDPPELIAEMIEKWHEGYDVVYASRRVRIGESWFKRFSAEGFYQVINKLSRVSIPPNTGDFRLIDRRVVESIKKMPERQRFMKGIFAWVGYKQTSILFDREPRYQGQTKWNYWKLWNFAIDGITSFSFLPLKVWTYVGLIIALVSLVYASFLILRTIIFGIDVPGYASLMVAVLFLGGIQLLTLGIIGEYIGRVYEEVKGRPLYLVRDCYGFENREQISDKIT